MESQDSFSTEDTKVRLIQTIKRAKRATLVFLNFCHSGIKEAKILTYRVEYTNSSPDNEVWIPPGPPQELQENIFWSDPRQTEEESINASGRHFSQYAKANEYMLPISKFEPPPSLSENYENRRF